MNQYRVFLTLFFSLAVLISLVFSEISLGSLQLERYFLVEKEGIIETKILVWNSGSSRFYLNFEVIETPKDVKILIEKNNILIQPNSVNSEEYEKILVDGLEIKAIPVKIRFYIIGNRSDGKVVIRAVAWRDDPIKELQVRQEREFVFFIVKNDSRFSEWRAEKTEDEIKVEKIKNISKTPLSFEKNLEYRRVLLSLFILFFLFLLVKQRKVKKKVSINYLKKI